MPVAIQCRSFPLTEKEAGWLWLRVVELRGCPDEIVTIRCVDEREIRWLNKRYRGRDKTTDVLVFSYEGEHDVAWRLSVTRRGSVARLLVHAFLHAAGMDHERSIKEAKKMEQAEAAVLASRGF